jgi:hypothetical protein
MDGDNATSTRDSGNPFLELHFLATRHVSSVHPLSTRRTPVSMRLPLSMLASASRQPTSPSSSFRTGMVTTVGRATDATAPLFHLWARKMVNLDIGIPGRIIRS